MGNANHFALHPSTASRTHDKMRTRHSRSHSSDQLPDFQPPAKQSRAECDNTQCKPQNHTMVSSTRVDGMAGRPDGHVGCHGDGDRVSISWLLQVAEDSSFPEPGFHGSMGVRSPHCTFADAEEAKLEAAIEAVVSELIQRGETDLREPHSTSTQRSLEERVSGLLGNLDLTSALDESDANQRIVWDLAELGEFPRDGLSTAPSLSSRQSSQLFSSISTSTSHSEDRREHAMALRLRDIRCSVDEAKRAWLSVVADNLQSSFKRAQSFASHR